jgi:hypothetical protein
MQSTQEILLAVREVRSSESNFDLIWQQLHRALKMAQEKNNEQLAEALQAVNDKYVPEYQTAKEHGGSAWPEFEKLVTQFERALTSAGDGA